MAYTRTRTFQNNANPVGGGLGPPADATAMNEWEAAHQEASDRLDAVETVVKALPAPSGDATGAADTAAIRSAITGVAAAGGGVVRARAGVVYQVAATTTQTVLNPSGSTGSRSICITLPPKVVLDMNGSTLQLRGTSEATIIGNQHLDNALRDTNLGLVNAVLDGRNITATSHSMLQLAYCDRLTLDNVKIINGSNQGGWVYDVTNSYFDRLDSDGFLGQPWTLGAPQATGTGHNQIYDSTFGTLLGQNTTLLNTGSQPGNPYNLVLTRCSIDSIRVRNCSGGIKLQQPSTDVTIGSVLLDTVGESSALNSGFKIQGDPTYAAGTDRPTRIKVGQVVAVNQCSMGLYLGHTQDCSVGSYTGHNNVTLHTGNSDVYMIGGVNDYVGHIDSRNSGGGGVRISEDAGPAGPVGYRIGNVRVTNCAQKPGATITTGVRVDFTSSGTFGDVVCVDDQAVHTMTRGFDVTAAGAVGTVDRFVSTGQTAEAFKSVAGGFPNPGDPVNGLTTGEEVFDRDLMTNNANGLASGAMRLTYLQARKTETTTGVRIVSGNTAAGATPTLARVGLYELDATGAGTLVAATANDTTLLAATNTVYTRAWATPVTKVAGRRYAVGVLIVTSAVVPTLSGLPSPTSSAEVSLAPRLTGSIGSLTDLPATFTAAGVGTSFTRFYAALA